MEREKSGKETLPLLLLSFRFPQLVPRPHTSVPEFLEAPLDPLDLQQEMEHLVVRLHQRGGEDGVQGPRNLGRECKHDLIPLA